jgi:dihydroflavonol-4-reductase
MAKALVTGAAGFIGCHVVRCLQQQNVEVRAMLAPNESDRAIAGLDVEKVVTDVRDKSAVEHAVAGCSQVYHLAAIYALYLDNRADMYNVNVDGTRHIMSACEKHQVEKVVHTSSIAAIGVTNTVSAATEDTPFRDFTIGDDYVLSKYISEQEALSWVPKDVPVVVVNPGFPFGPYDFRPTPTGRMVLEILQERLPGYFPGGLTAVDVEDVAMGHVLAAQKGEVGKRYLLSGTNLTYRDFILSTASRAGVKPSGRKLPLPVARLVAHAFVARRKLFGIDPLLTPGLLNYSARHLYYDNTRAKKELGWETTPLNDTLDKTITFFRTELAAGSFT